MEMSLSGRLLKWPERGKFGPMLKVDFIARAPILMLGEKCVFRSNDLAFEVGSKCGMIFC